ncbi:adenosylcobalamin-dependent ribonucleoside-diphosphate reductase [Streptomyces heilongjiangensis]|uniref:Vitamin B12-dependent ribonucleotide reductase n=1 Tax=Streptomyces heilongjiangensis TaxID=945052 RepID=A0ABW1BJJ9_9ACTN|nr:adenosylcobalamin-dependent ribonucleoside-diphosphate reductase [Streptomyces heilongjiangensis]MDC2952118.1 adenosylcobalamin-dependent ribonucleoside-diphosphate reductase [Streptomyces heilongjiangensis]
MNTEVLRAKLARRIGEERRVESTDELLDRVSATLGEVERRYRDAGDAEVRHWSARFRALMEENRFWPSGRILNNTGTRQAQLASCFVLPLSDEFGSVFDALKIAAACHRTGGGTGFDLSPLRERGAPISTAEAAGASGPVSWLRLFDAETTVVAQGGKMRGANLGSLSVYHPDIMEFVDAKRTVGRLHNFNISVAVDDAFMRAVEEQRKIELVSPLNGQVTGRIAAGEIWQRICENAWRTGDPGLLFTDAINRANPLAGHLGPIRTTNPCGEQTLYPYEASNLGSINLAAFLRADRGDVEWDLLRDTVRDAVRLLDNAIDASRYPEPRITEMAQSNRRLGLGVMGYADLLVRLGIPYDSDAAMELIDRLGAAIRDAAWAASEELAQERGAYPHWPHSGRPVPVRNCAITTIAPTGTISMIAGCSSGIEPRFAPVWNKDVLTVDGIANADEDLIDELKRHSGLGRDDALALLRNKPVAELPLPAHVLAPFRYAHAIPGTWHVRTVARWQRYTDNAVSKTVNLSHGCAVADVSESFFEAWRLGCKGLSVYREGSRDRDLLTATHAESEPEPPRQSKQLVGVGDL